MSVSCGAKGVLGAIFHSSNSGSEILQRFNPFSVNIIMSPSIAILCVWAEYLSSILRKYSNSRLLYSSHHI